MDEIVEDTEVQLLDSMNEPLWYAIKLDEDVHEDMLYVLLLSTNTTSAELFKSLDYYILGKLNLAFCVSLCPDGASTMTGELSGFTTQFKQFVFECESM